MATVKKEIKKPRVLKGVTLLYAKIAEPDFKYESTTEKEYSVQLAVSEAVAKSWDKEFKKQKSNSMTADEFKGKFGIDAPYGEDDVYMIKLKKQARITDEDGEPVEDKYRPKVYLDTLEDKVKIRTDITVSRLISNGTVADVSFTETDNKFGHFAHLANIRIDEENFKEYFRTGGGGSGSEFDDEDETPVETRKEPEKKEATQGRAASKAKAKPAPAEEEEDDDSESPF